MEKKLYEKFRGHLGTVATHKKFVAEACFKMGIYVQGITHDLSKFSPTEFIPSVMYYDGTHSPTIEERKDIGYSNCWVHHKGRNKHHYEYWTDYPLEKGLYMKPVKMPMKYVAEMIADRYAACKAYQGDAYTQESAWNYYFPWRDGYIIDPDTRAVLEKVLHVMKTKGEDAAFKYMKTLLTITTGSDYTAAMLGLTYDPLEEPVEKPGEKKE